MLGRAEVLTGGIARMLQFYMHHRLARPGSQRKIKALAKSKERPTLKIEGWGTRNGNDNYKDKGNHDGNCDDGGILRCARMTANVYGNVYDSGYG